MRAGHPHPIIVRRNMENIVVDKSLNFAVRIVNLYKYLQKEKKEYILSKQLLRSGTSVGANIAESQNAQSNSDFISKMSISRKELSETMYWLELLHRTDYIDQNAYNSVYADAKELYRIISSIIKTSESKNEMIF